VYIKANIRLSYTFKLWSKLKALYVDKGADELDQAEQHQKRARKVD